MTKPHLTTRHDRESAKYRDLHKRLARELKAERVRRAIGIKLLDTPEPDEKRARKRQASEDFRAGRT